MMYLLLLLGFVFLLKGADLFVDGSSSIARFFKIPSVIIGLTIVAMGTSAPETAVSITAGLAGNSDISLGNIVGSNIFNLLMVIGISALIRPVASNPEILRRDLWWNLGATLLLLLTLLDGGISRPDGLMLLAGFVIYMVIVIRSGLKSRQTEDASDSCHAPGKSALLILAGLAAIIIGGKLIVNNASLIAASFGMSDTLIGLTIVAVGTSLPELMTSIVAARKGDAGIALGNAVGSCIFNILFILGAASALTPIHVVPELLTDTVILIVTGALITVFARTKLETGRAEGAVSVLCYLCYSAYIILR